MKFFSAVWKLSIYAFLGTTILNSGAQAVTTPFDLCSGVKAESPPLINVQLLSGCLTKNNSEFDRSELLKLRAKGYLQLGRFEQALEDFDAALELHPKDAEVYNGRGIVYKRLGDYKLAMKNYAIAQDLRAQQPAPIVVLQPEPIIEPPSSPAMRIARIKANPSKIVFSLPAEDTEILVEKMQTSTVQEQSVEAPIVQ